MKSLLESLLSKGERVVVTGLKKSGKSYTIKDFYPDYNTFRDGSWWNTMSIVSKKFYDAYKLFDRCNWIERYVWLRKGKESLKLCVEKYVENLPDTYLIINLDDRYAEQCGYNLIRDARKTLVSRYLEIGKEIWATGKVKGVIVMTPNGFGNVEYWKDEESFWRFCKKDSMKDKMERNPKFENVRENLIEAANKYYAGEPTGIDDKTYDSWMEYVKLGEPSFNIFEHVKTIESAEGSIPHTIRIPVFEKHDFKELESMKEYPSDWVFTPKNDGCSIVAYYLDGKLQYILTRSDEQTGKVQTNKLRGKVPNEVNPEIRAILFEAVVPTNRSKANGLINSKYKQDEVDELITLRPFDCVLWKRVLPYEERMNLTGLDYCTLTIQDALSLRGQGDEPKLDGNIPVDGIVVYSNVNPTFGRIFKFYATDDKETVVEKLEFSTSPKTGLVNIVAQVEPVKIGPTNIRRIGNVGTWKTVKERKLGKGSKVSVFLAKMTIPAIRSENSKWEEEPKPVCDWCGSPLEEFGGKLVCKNPDCGFWEDYFTTKYFNLLREKMGTEWVDEFTVNGKFGIDMLARAEVKSGFLFCKLLRYPKYLFYLLEPPRIQGSIYNQVLRRIVYECEQKNPKDLFEAAEIVINSVNSPDQHSYSEMVWGKLKYFLMKLKSIRNGYLSSN